MSECKCNKYYLVKECGCRKACRRCRYGGGTCGCRYYQNCALDIFNTIWFTHRDNQGCSALDCPYHASRLLEREENQKQIELEILAEQKPIRIGSKTKSATKQG